MKSCCWNLNKVFLIFFHIFRMCFSLCPCSPLQSTRSPRGSVTWPKKIISNISIDLCIILSYFRLLEWAKWVNSSKNPKTNLEQNKNSTPSWEWPKNRCSYHLFVYSVFCRIQIYISLWSLELKYLILFSLQAHRLWNKTLEIQNSVFSFK